MPLSIVSDLADHTVPWGNKLRALLQAGHNDDGTNKPVLTPTAVKTSAYSAAAFDLVPVDTTSGNVTVTLPSAPVDGAQVVVKHVIQGGTNTVTIARGGTDVFNKTGGGTSLILTLLNQGAVLQYKASGGIWYVVADDLALSTLDSRYAAAGGGGASAPSAWSTTLSASTSIGATSISVTDALPMNLNLGHGCSIVIDAWTANAEGVWAGPSSGTGKAIALDRGGGNTLQVAHPAGATVHFLQDNDVCIDWFGPLLVSAAQNVTAIHRCFNQLQYMAEGIGYGFIVRGLGGRSLTINSTITAPSTGMSELRDLSLTCTTDFGAGTVALNFVNARCKLTNVGVTSSNPSITMAQFLAGGAWGAASSPPVAMDGIALSQRTTVENCSATGFRGGFFFDFFDHAVMRNCGGTNNLYTYMFNHAGQDGGDMSFYKCNSDGAYRSAWAVLNGAGPEGVTWKDCSWANSPFAWYFSNGGYIIAGTFINCNCEFLGNCSMYFVVGGILQQVRVIDGNGQFTLMNPSSAAGWTDPTLTGTGNGIICFGGDLTVRDCRWTTGYPGSALPIFARSTGTGNLTQFNNDISSDHTGTPGGIVGAGGLTSNSSRFIHGDGRASGRATVQTTGTVTAYDLLEETSSGTVQTYQTAGAPPEGVAFGAFTPAGGCCTVIDEGVVSVNVAAANSIAAGKYVKPDASNNGKVVQASSFSDGPIVGRSLAASASNRVVIKLML